jgi:uncharacterized membrane protein
MSGTGHSKHRDDAHGPGHALERLIFFSDAVFAIAITLLVIDLHVPDLPRTNSDLTYLIALANMGAHFAGFFISFFVIGAFWAAHHRGFDCARHWSPNLIMPNLMLLCTIAAMPFFTAFSSQHWNERVPVTLYCGWLLLTAVFNLRVLRIVTAPPVVSASLDPPHRAMILRRGVSVILGAATALIVGLFFPWLGTFSLMSIPLWRALLNALASRQSKA